MQLVYFDHPNNGSSSSSTTTTSTNLEKMDSKIDLSKTPLNNDSYNNNIDGMRSSEIHVQKSYKRRTKLVKLLTALVLVLITVLVIFMVLYFNVNLQKKKAEESKMKDEEYCQEKECVQISARIIETMDQSVDPCHNFYDYACGNWIRKTPIPDSRARYSRFEKLAEDNSIILKQIINNLISKKLNASTPILTKAATYYKSCFDVKKIEEIGDRPMKEYIKKLGSWPVTDHKFDVKKWDLMRTFVLLHKNISRAPVFNLFVTGDIKNSNENVLVFDQSGLGMSDRNSYLKNDTFYLRKRTSYKKLMKEIVTQLGANETGVKLMEKVFDFERELAKITATVMERRSFRDIYKTMTLDEFANKTEIPKNWIKEFVESTVLMGKSSIDLSTRIVSYGTNYIKKAFKLFMNLKPEVQVSYLMWHAVKLMAPVVMGPYQDFMDEYYRTVHQIKSRPPRWETCITNTMNSFGYGMARPFVEQVYDKTAKTMSTEMIRAIKLQFGKNLDEMDWMDKKTKSYAKLKASKILDNIGYPDTIMNNTALEKDYGDIEVVDGQYFLNYMEKVKYNNLKNYRKYGKPVDKSEWGVLPTAVNAYYAPTENKIGFPAGILQWPFYDKRSPRAVSYGAIGMVVGHEVSHAFDDQGKDFTIEGNYNTWWTSHSAEAFKKKSQCFIDQYSNFTLFGEHMNGRQTLGEDLADNGGLRQAFQAYKLWVEKNGPEKKLPGLDLTPEQLYFLAFGQVWCTAYRQSAAIMQIQNGVHSLSKFRVIGTLQNSEEFSKAYNCPAGSPMNPKKKCRIW